MKWIYVLLICNYSNSYEEAFYVWSLINRYLNILTGNNNNGSFKKKIISPQWNIICMQTQLF